MCIVIVVFYIHSTVIERRSQERIISNGYLTRKVASFSSNYFFDDIFLQRDVG